MKTNIKNVKKLLSSFIVSVIFISYIIYQQGGKGNINLGNNTSANFPEAGTAQSPGRNNQSGAANVSYKDGQYTGNSINALYGNVKVEVTISGGKITDVQFLDHPNSRGTSISINNYAMPILKSEAIQAQSAQVDTVSGATYTSDAFINSLSSALSQA